MRVALSSTPSSLQLFFAIFSSMKVLKFGGSSLASPERVVDVGKIVLNAARQEPVIVVVSAFQGITNELIECVHLAAVSDDRCETKFAAIADRHLAATDELIGKRRGARSARQRVKRLLEELHDVLRGIRLLGNYPPQAMDTAASFGERLSAWIVASHLRRFARAEFFDARQLVLTDHEYTHANVLFRQTNDAIRRRLGEMSRGRPRRIIPVVTGFIGSTIDGHTTTIGRNGSDYSAAIIGAALNATAIEIWTDVDGVLSADPRVVRSAFVLPHISYEEAMELSYFGAKVLHPASVAPAIAKSIPILIKNTLNPAAPGTLISRARRAQGRIIKGISSVDRLTLITLRGLNMVGVPGVAERLFGALAARKINVILISQASSEHTICFAVSAADTEPAVTAVEQEFRREFSRRLTRLDQRFDQAIIAVVGDRMQGRPGVAADVFGALARHSVNINAIAQGASERNISCVIDASEQNRALNIVHQEFFEKRKQLALVVVGVGTIGSALIQQLHDQNRYLLEQGFDVRIVAVANSKRFVSSAEGLDLTRWREQLAASRRRMNAVALAKEVATLTFSNAAIVDCTADPKVVDAYPQFVKADFHIITPNKRANVLPWRRYASLIELLARRRKYFLFEANVGAGLPILSTLRDLIASGDVVTKIEGIFSGTLSYLFNTFDGTVPFSALVREAHRLGLTEPDARDDLSGADVGRKLLILARQIGLKMDLGDVRVNSLVPRSLADGPFSAGFFARYRKHDGLMLRRFERAQHRGARLRYVGELENGRARAGIGEYAHDHPFAAAKGTDNVFAFTTKRYAQTPLVVQGPGAGADVTAMGVFSDILKLLHYLPH